MQLNFPEQRPMKNSPTQQLAGAAASTVTDAPEGALISIDSQYRLLAASIFQRKAPATVRKYPATQDGLAKAGDDARRLSRCLTLRKKLRTVGDWDPEEAQFYIATGASEDQRIEVNPPPEWAQLLGNALRWKDPLSSAASQVSEPCGIWRCLFQPGDPTSRSGDDQRSNTTRDAICAVEYAVARASLEVRLAETAGALEQILPTWHFYDAFYEYLFHAYGENRGESADNELIDGWKRPEETRKFIGMFRQVVHDICQQVRHVQKQAEAVVPDTARSSITGDLLLFVAEVQTARLSSIRVPTGLF